MITFRKYYTIDTPDYLKFVSSRTMRFTSVPASLTIKYCGFLAKYGTIAYFYFFFFAINKVNYNILNIFYVHVWTQ